ncbi:hypothetical protein VD0002_g8021 [Verticillium dahliae]|nr:hypothetical protein BJF96_g926 [Verticillium dahliae]PNH42659.1 hypothetical protein VD0004_g4692 [Verticillium dahliae]PNH49074.1 hypothetical protein VD0003_g8053 [Verticillium dahliae]PNH59534.1 hypothetical protein VD0002_g8021 [Verticillium dahliae]PNH62877.1 hypothetical protein VD0001_g9324 [Verticillium dahliae]
MSLTSSPASARGLRFPLDLRRFLPYIGYHHVLMIFLVISVTLISILIAGCTSDSLAGIYLLSLSYVSNPEPSASNVAASIAEVAVNRTSMEIRAGYMGMCLLVSGQSICSKNSGSLEAFVRRTTIGDESGDPLNLIHAAQKFRDETVFVALLFISIVAAIAAILLLATFPGWHEDNTSNGSEREVKPFPSRVVSRAALGCLVVSCVLTLLTGFWQHLSSSSATTMVKFFTYGVATGHVGAGAMALGWLATFFLIVACIGLLVMILSISVLSNMVG